MSKPQTEQLERLKLSLAVARAQKDHHLLKQASAKQVDLGSAQGVLCRLQRIRERQCRRRSKMQAL